MKADPYWKSAVIAAKIMKRKEKGLLNARDRRVARSLVERNMLEDRLIYRALNALGTCQNYYAIRSVASA